MGERNINMARRIAMVMETLPEHKQEILLAYGEGMAFRQAQREYVYPVPHADGAAGEGS